MAGTSPSVSYYGPRQSYQTYFQSEPGKLGELSGFGGKDLLAKDDYPIDPETSPSTGGGDIEIADHGDLGFAAAPGFEIAPGSSPSVDYFPEPDRVTSELAVAWEHDDAQFDLNFLIDRFTKNSDSPLGASTSLSMMPGTSPAIAVQPDGSYEVAFQASDGALSIVTPNDDPKNPYTDHPTTDKLDRFSSPVITALPHDGFEIAYTAADDTLWTVNGLTQLGQQVPGAAVAPGTSPSISAYRSTYHSASSPSPNLRSTRPLAPVQASQYTVENCSHIKLTSAEAAGRTLQVWVKDDSVPGSTFQLAHVLDGGTQDGTCGTPGVSPSYDLNPVAGHTYEVHIDGVTSQTVTCADTPTSCPLEWATVTGAETADPVTLQINVL